jgi:hypothetical protein
MSFSENEIYSIEDIMDEVQRTNPSIRSVFSLQSRLPIARREG